MDQEQPQQQINPLENFVANALSVEELLSIHNRYAPPEHILTLEQLEEISHGDPNEAKTYLLRIILTAAINGTLVRSDGSFSTKKGMKELENIILDLKRDVKRVSKAISPQGAQDIVDKHNRANPKSLWSLDTSDRNKDGIPDVVIQNSRGESMYVNGYTTKRSDWPHQYSYYYNFPTRKDRSGKPLSLFKKAFWQTNYTEDGDDYNALGDVTYVDPFGDQVNLSGYGIHEPKRMSPYTRYRKFVIGPLFPEVIRELAQNNQIYVPKRYRLQILASACARLWENDLDHFFYQRFGATTKEAQTKVKKNYKGEIDNFVTAGIQEINTNRQRRNELKEAVKQCVREVATQVADQYPDVDFRQLYQQDLAIEQARQQANRT